MTIDEEVWTQTFTYDPLNRIDTATEAKSGVTQWQQSYDYDRYGNRCLRSTTAPCVPEIKPANNNRLNAYSYDLSGNQLTDGAEPIPHSYTYNAENLLKTVDGVTAYVYNGEGQRVRKLVGEKLRMVYGISGGLIAEYDDVSGGLKKEYIYGVSRLLATIEPIIGTRYVTMDMLGTPRVVTSNVGEVASRHDYQPFGEELFAGMGNRTIAQGYSSPSNSLRQKFTGKERDSETGLDYFFARYYASAQGRFTSADNFLNDTHVVDPASWNLYVYARNNPLKYIDPTGEVVDGTELSPDQRQQLIDDWKRKTGYQDIQFVQSGKRLILKINEKIVDGGSATARKELLQAVNTTLIFDLKAAGTDKNPSRDDFSFGKSNGPDLSQFDERGGLVVNVIIDFEDHAAQHGDEDVMDAHSIGLTALHEIEHFLHGLKLDYGSESAPGDIEGGFINPIRRELGLPERQNYEPRSFSKGKKGERYGSYIFKTKDGAEKILSWRKSQVKGGEA